MDRIILVLAAAAISLLGACASKPETQPNVEAAEGKTESAGGETHRRYRDMEGSSSYSSEDAEEQLEGD